ncbi:MAG: adenosylcobinamide-phosphate synthase CbiB [Nitrospinota bacterium]
MFENNGLVILFAFTLDLLLGDPDWIPHPVRWIGKGIKIVESFLRKTRIPLKISGILLAVCIVLFTFITTFFLIKFTYSINTYLGFFISIITVYISIAPRNLHDESMKVYRCLKNREFKSARRNLSMIVGRDTHGLNEMEIIRASVETVAENIVDAVISPIFYTLMGGATMAFVYRAINTMDSMVGYKNNIYIDFGWAAARLDDIANYVPARISAVLIPLSSFICGNDWLFSFKIALRDGNKNPSPNSGIPESAVAGALGIQLGGLNFYGGIPSQKPLIGNSISELSVRHIREVNRLMFVTSILLVSLCLLVSW